MLRNLRLLLWILIPGAALALLAGCGKPEPRFTVVKDLAPPPESAPAGPMAMADGHAHGPGLHFTLPAGWTQREPARMQLVTITAGQPPELPAEVSVAAFPGDVGGQLANINRWRGQVGLGPIGPELVGEFVEGTTLAGLPGWRVDFTGAGEAPARVVVAVVLREGQSWFFKLMGPEASVAGELERFQAFLDSIHFHAP